MPPEQRLSCIKLIIYHLLLQIITVTGSDRYMDKIHSLFLGFGKNQENQQIQIHSDYASILANTEVKAGNAVDLGNGLILYKNSAGNTLRVQTKEKFEKTGNREGVEFDLKGNYQSSSDSDVLDRLQLPMNAPQPPPQSNDAFQGSHSSAAAAPASSFPKAPEIRPIVQAWSNALITNNRLKTFETLNEFNKKATDTEKEARRNMIKFLFPFETGYYNISYENDILFTEGDYSGTRSLECINKNPYMLHSHYMDQPRYHSVTCNLLTGERHEKKYLGDPGKFSNFFNAP